MYCIMFVQMGSRVTRPCLEVRISPPVSHNFSVLSSININNDMFEFICVGFK